MWMTQKLAGKKQNIDATWKLLHKEVDLGEPTSVLDHVFLGCTQRQCEISKDIVDNCRTMFESRISAEWTENLPFSENLRISSWVLWYGGSCKAMCGAILWVSKQDDSTTLQSIHSIHRWPPVQKRRTEICWRIVTNMLSNWSKIVETWHELEDLIFYGQWINLVLLGNVLGSLHFAWEVGSNQTNF